MAYRGIWIPEVFKCFRRLCHQLRQFRLLEETRIYRVLADLHYFDLP